MGEYYTHLRPEVSIKKIGAKSGGFLNTGRARRGVGWAMPRKKACTRRHRPLASLSYRRPDDTMELHATEPDNRLVLESLHQELVSQDGRIDDVHHAVVVQVTSDVNRARLGRNRKLVRTGQVAQRDLLGR